MTRVIEKPGADAADRHSSARRDLPTPGGPCRSSATWCGAPSNSRKSSTWCRRSTKGHVSLTPVTACSFRRTFAPDRSTVLPAPARRPRGPVRDAQIIGDVVGRVVAPQHRGPRRRGGVVVQDLVPGVPIGEADAGEGVVATCEAAYAEVAVPPVDSAIATFRWRRTAMRAPSCRRTVVPVSASRCDR